MYILCSWSDMASVLKTVLCPSGNASNQNYRCRPDIWLYRKEEPHYLSVSMLLTSHRSDNPFGWATCCIRWDNISEKRALVEKCSLCSFSHHSQQSSLNPIQATRSKRWSKDGLQTLLVWVSLTPRRSNPSHNCWQAIFLYGSLVFKYDWHSRLSRTSSKSSRESEGRKTCCVSTFKWSPWETTVNLAKLCEMSSLSVPKCPPPSSTFLFPGLPL